MRSRAALLAALSVAGTAGAQGGPPWTSLAGVPLDETARSVAILRADEPLLAAPHARAPRRGAARLGARLPLYAATPGDGCRTDFVMVGPGAWACGDAAQVTGEAPVAAESRTPGTADGLPFEYHFVREEGAVGYRDLATAGETRAAGELSPGFAVALVERGVHGTDPFGLTTKGLWVPLASLERARSIDFEGYAPEAGLLDFGWAITETAVLGAPGGRRIAGATLARFERVRREEEAEAGGRRFVRVGEARWVPADTVRFPETSTRPPEVRPGERWMDVDRASQVLVAYEGDRAVFTTLVSTGVGRGDDPTVTPAGSHRIWVKLRTADMTNLEDPAAAHYYAMQEVPWVMFFKKGYGLHGAFWHHSFGHVRSHGCVNLSPRDAARLFDWVGPRLPAGWTAVLPTDYDPGTLVRVR